jgi:chromosome segregation ATPase
VDTNRIDLDDAPALRSRLVEYERLWAEASARLAAFARLEELAQQQAVTPEALARRVAAERYEARVSQLRSEVEALEATAASVNAEIARYEAGRLEAVRRFTEAHHRLQALEADLTRLVADRDVQHQELLTLTAQLDQRAREVHELAESRDSLYLEVTELLEGIEAVQDAGGAFATATQRAAVTEAGGKIDPVRFGDEDDADAFDEFFNADVGHDRSRDWILRDAGPSART